MSVEVGAKALRARSVHHSEVAALVPEQSPSRLMLLFYAVECGLKAAILLRRSSRGTQDLDEGLKSHDLVRLAKELRLPLDLMPSPAYRGRTGAGSVAAKDLHLAWRYGMELHESDQAEAQLVLSRLLEWSRSELRA